MRCSIELKLKKNCQLFRFNLGIEIIACFITEIFDNIFTVGRKFYNFQNIYS